MNSKGHLTISIFKSIIRIVGCFMAITTQSIMPLSVSFLLAEILGITEELVDKR